MKITVAVIHLTWLDISAMDYQYTRNLKNSKDYFPVLLHSHGWVGVDDAPNFNFFLDQKGSQAKYIDSFAKQGFVVITPGWRGHGTVNNIPADGIEFMQSWDNASYLSPIFYSFDLLNALEGVASLNSWPTDIKVDLNNVFLSSHSQGGDSALVALAIAGEGSNVKQNIKAASFFAACFLPRLEQGKLYGSMALTPEAFLASNGDWTASKLDKTGKINPDLQFPYPPDWIETTNVKNWTWQKEVWQLPTVKSAFKYKYDEMYRILSTQGLTNEFYHLSEDKNGKTQVNHPSYIEDAYAKTSAINYIQWLSEPVILHHSDQDYYSPSRWNEHLEQELIKQKSPVFRYEYKGNTHSLTVSKHKWFSKPDAVAGLNEMIKTDLNLFSKLMQEK